MCKREIYVDMDGVIADFFGCLSRQYNVADWKTLIDPKDKPQFKKHVTDDVYGSDFFSNIKKFEDADNLIKMVSKYSKNGYTLLTTPLFGDEKHTQKQKIIWVKKHLIDLPPKEIIFENKKENWAIKKIGNKNISNVLIDDHSVNCENFQKKGGISIRYQSGVDTLEYVENKLKQINF